MAPLVIKSALIVASLAFLFSVKFIFMVKKNDPIEEAAEEIVEQVIKSQTGIDVHIPD